MSVSACPDAAVDLDLRDRKPAALKVPSEIARRLGVNRRQLILRPPAASPHWLAWGCRGILPGGMMPRAGFDPASPTRKASILSILNYSLTGLYYRGPARGSRKHQLEVSGSSSGRASPRSTTRRARLEGFASRPAPLGGRGWSPSAGRRQSQPRPSRWSSRSRGTPRRAPPTCSRAAFPPEGPSSPASAWRSRTPPARSATPSPEGASARPPRRASVRKGRPSSGTTRSSGIPSGGRAGARPSPRSASRRNTALPRLRQPCRLRGREVRAEVESPARERREGRPRSSPVREPRPRRCAEGLSPRPALQAPCPGGRESLSRSRWAVSSAT